MTGNATTASAMTPQTTTADAISLNAKPSATYADKLAETQALLRTAAEAFGAASWVTQASSLGAEDVVITHLINALALDIPVFVLETGKLHTETTQLLEQTKHNSRAEIVVFYPSKLAADAFVATHGEEAMYQSIALRKACCQIRKMEPLARALDGKKGWITGLRREQSGARADVPLIDTSDLTSSGRVTSDSVSGELATAGRVKYNPLADWTWGDVWHYIGTNSVAYNPLHDQFFPSIGCAPCTRAISLGEDFRAGRWWWEAELVGGATKECGLHVKNEEQGSTA